MNLSNFFRRKAGDKIDFKNEKDLGKVIGQGIFFEDTGKFLKWGTPVKDLAKDVAVKEKIFADRTVYQWGVHNILDGLSLDFTTTFWNHREESRYKRFNVIDFWAIGNEQAGSYLKLIKSHLENKFGAPGKKYVSETEESLEWVISEARLHLHFFEQYANKLHFEISKVY